MAGKTTVNIPGEDGRDREVTLPAYAMDSTLRDLVKAMSALSGISEETKKAMENLGKDTNDNFKNQNATDKKRNEIANNQLNSLKNLNKTVEENAEDAKKQTGVLREAFEDAGGVLKSLFLGAISLTSTALYNLVTTGYNTGQVLVDLNRQGILFNKTLDGMTASEAFGSLTALGMQASDAGQILGDYSRVVATLGVSAITDQSRAIANSTKMGAEFGMTMSELTGYISDELDIRQTLGMIDQLQRSRVSKSSEELFRKQIQFSQVLGTSMDDLQKSAAGILDNPMARSAFALIDELGTSSEDLANQLRISTSQMAGMGFDQKLIDQIGNEMFDITAFFSDAGMNLQAAFASTGTAAGKEVVGMISEINSAIANNDIKTATKKIGDLPGFMEDAINDMGPEGIASFRRVATEIGGEMGASLLMSMNSVRLYQKNLEALTEAHKKQGDTTKLTTDEFQSMFNNLAQASKSFEQSKKSITGALDTIRMASTGILQQSGIADAVTNVLTRFSSMLVDRSKEINDAITRLAKRFGFLDGNADDLSTTIGEGLIDTMGNFIDHALDFIESINPEMLSGLFDTVTSTFTSAIDAVNLVIAGLSAFGNFLTSSMFSDDASFWLKGAELFAKVFGTAFLASAAVRLVGKGVSAVTGGLLGGKDKAAPSSVAAGVGQGLGKAGAGIKMFGKGLASFPAAAILGAGKLAAAIAIIAGAVGLSGYIIGLGLGSMAEAFKKFNEVDGMNLLKVGGGLIALSAGMLAFGAGAVVGAIGNIVGGILDGLNEMFGGESMFDKLKTFGEMELNYNGIRNNAEAVAAYGVAMGKLGGGQLAAGFGNLVGTLMDGLNEFFGGKTPFEKMEEFGNMNFDTERIARNAGAFGIFAEALSKASKADFTALDDIGDIMDDVNDELEHFSNTKKIDPVGLASNANSLKVYAGALKELSRVNPDKITSLGEAIGVLHQALSNYTGPGYFESLAQMSGQTLDVVSTMMFGNGENAQPSTEAVSTADSGSESSKEAQARATLFNAMIDPAQLNRLEKVLIRIEEKTLGA